MGSAASSLSDRGTQLLKCASKGDAAAVDALTGAYPQLLCYSNFLQTSCWHLAARAGSSDVLAVLVSRAEDIKFRHCLASARRSSRSNTSNDRGQQQQQQQRESLVQQLVNARTSKDITPLMMAAESGCADSVRLLLRQGADPWAADKLGSTALHYGAGSGKPAVLLLLLEAAGEVGPVHSPNAAHTRYSDVRNTVGHTAVHYAVQAGAQQALAVLLSAGANPLMASLCDCMVCDNLPKGSSPLHVAARRNEPALATQLLTAYAEHWQHRGMPDPRQFGDRNHQLPFQLALRHNNTQLAECLQPSTPLASLFGAAAGSAVDLSAVQLDNRNVLVCPFCRASVGALAP
ncbi:hypothetical protein OEZ85_003219 [Tetradesmus obliquus]|uniref:Uncharacterized protein n=1 Tax=Tetradesmus obliquus TaxID=3088 RepID=A0ABY8TZZ6_TETOB|nr:hypothetical protein OEZ85_003219 [Tetradesmus obliquus]